jgi:hypothetical protein
MVTLKIWKEPHAENSRRKKWTHKLGREFNRLAFQLNTLRMRPLALTVQNNFVFILGHMRSGSTLLTHLLCTSDEIVGYGETHTNYRRRSDLAKLLCSVRVNTTLNPLKYRYVLEKIVSTQHPMCRAVLMDQRIRYVFLIREPLGSLASIVNMRQHFHPDETPSQAVAFAAQHYTERLGQLRRFAEAIDDPQRCLLVTHNQVLNDTPATFTALESFLDLRSPLREEYDVTPTTGKPGVGDPFPNIRLGKIHRSLPKKHVDLSDSQRYRVQQCYGECAQTLSAIMQTPSPQYVSTIRRAA